MRQRLAVCMVIVACILVESEAKHRDSPQAHHHHHKKRDRKHHDRQHHHSHHSSHHTDNIVSTASDPLEIHTVKIGWLNVPRVVGCRCRHEGAICIKGPDGKPTCVQRHPLQESARLFRHYHEMKERAEEDLNELDPPNDSQHVHTPFSHHHSEVTNRDSPRSANGSDLDPSDLTHRQDKGVHDNSVLSSEGGCDKATMEEMRRRLTSWFHLLHYRARPHHHGNHHHAQHHLSVKKELRQAGAEGCGCLRSVLWQFHQLDVDSSHNLSQSELTAMDNSEPCLLPYLHSCDSNHDHILTTPEWCCCFHHKDSESPCYAKLDEIESTKNTEPYIPSCDNEGFYRAEQCKGENSGQTCWCVTQNGDEITGTRKAGRAHCSKLNKEGGPKDMT